MYLSTHYNRDRINEIIVGNIVLLEPGEDVACDRDLLLLVDCVDYFGSSNRSFTQLVNGRCWRPVAIARFVESEASHKCAKYITSSLLIIQHSASIDFCDNADRRRTTSHLGPAIQMDRPLARPLPNFGHPLWAMQCASAHPRSVRYTTFRGLQDHS